VRVLVFSTISPSPVDRGDRNRLTHSIQLLARLATVRVAYLARGWEADGLQQACGGVSYRRIPVSKRAVLCRGAMAAMRGQSHAAYRYDLPAVVTGLQEEMEGFRPDILWLFQASTVPALRVNHSSRVVVDLVDSPTRYLEAERRQGHESLKWAMRSLTQWGTAEAERALVARAAVVLVNSELDRDHVRRRYSCENVHILRNCVPASLLEKRWRPISDGEAPTMLFVGNLAYRPNAMAVRELARRILPCVRARFPESQLRVCGARGESLEKELGDLPGVSFLGFVPDLEREYLRASVFVSPVPFAGGTQYKLLEAMAVGTPCVTSAASADVTGVTDGKEVIVAEDPEGYAAGVEALYREKNRAILQSEAARAFIRVRHMWDQYLPLVKDALGGTGEWA
jgi:glycosyltransferase involved in cell wall biosynthesis